MNCVSRDPSSDLLCLTSAEDNMSGEVPDGEVPAHKKSDLCKHHSCKLQKCLQDTNYQMDRCEHHLHNMIECCRQEREKAFSCEGFMWMFKEAFDEKKASKYDEKVKDKLGPDGKYKQKWYQNN